MGYKSWKEIRAPQELGSPAVGLKVSYIALNLILFIHPTSCDSQLYFQPFYRSSAARLQVLLCVVFSIWSIISSPLLQTNLTVDAEKGQKGWPKCN